jgi:hypothetical protein
MSSNSGIMGISARNQPRESVSDYELLKIMEAENGIYVLNVSVSSLEVFEVLSSNQEKAVQVMGGTNQHNVLQCTNSNCKNTLKIIPMSSACTVHAG